MGEAARFVGARGEHTENAQMTNARQRLAASRVMPVIGSARIESHMGAWLPRMERRRSQRDQNGADSAMLAGALLPRRYVASVEPSLPGNARLEMNGSSANDHEGIYRVFKARRW